MKIQIKTTIFKQFHKLSLGKNLSQDFLDEKSRFKFFSVKNLDSSFLGKISRLIVSVKYLGQFFLGEKSQSLFLGKIHDFKIWQKISVKIFSVKLSITFFSLKMEIQVFSVKYLGHIFLGIISRSRFLGKTLGHFFLGKKSKFKFSR